MSELNNTRQQSAGAEETTRSADQKFCYSCGLVLHASATGCTKCGAIQSPVPALGMSIHQPNLTSSVPKLLANQVFCRGCSAPLHETAITCPKCGAKQATTAVVGSGRNRVIAAVLAFFLGWIGGHKFYLGQIGAGILYLIFFWTAIPGLISLIEGIFYLTMSDDEFSRKY